MEEGTGKLGREEEKEKEGRKKGGRGRAVKQKSRRASKLALL